MKDFAKKLLDVYLVLIKALLPVTVACLPIIPTIKLDNGLYLIGLAVSVPVGIVLAEKLWP